MPAPRIVIVTPAPPGSRAGNRRTALRWARLLRGLGARVAIRSDWDGGNEDLMIALHARRSHRAMQAWRARHGQRPLVLALTGTDIYHDIRIDATARASLELASRLVVLQAAALEELTPGQRSLCRVIHQSVTLGTPDLPFPPAKLPRRFRFCLLGHLREEKDPFRAVLAMQCLPDLPKQARFEVVQAGAALSDCMAGEARRLMSAE
ncbi:MAG: TIGR04348 family glycosyltransferase, partial [Pseudomonadota bacterium]